MQGTRRRGTFSRARVVVRHELLSYVRKLIKSRVNNFGHTHAPSLRPFPPSLCSTHHTHIYTDTTFLFFLVFLGYLLCFLLLRSSSCLSSLD